MITRHRNYALLFLAVTCIFVTSVGGLSACAKPVTAPAPTPASTPVPEPEVIHLNMGSTSCVSGLYAWCVAGARVINKVDPEEVEIALSELAKPWQMANTGGYCMPHPMSWERASVASGNWRPDMQRKLTDEQAHRLRETLLKLNYRITIKNHTIFISGRLPLTSVRVKQTAS